MVTSDILEIHFSRLKFFFHKNVVLKIKVKIGYVL